MMSEQTDAERKQVSSRMLLHSDLISFLSKVDPSVFITSTTMELIVGWYEERGRQALKEVEEGTDPLEGLKVFK